MQRRPAPPECHTKISAATGRPTPPPAPARATGVCTWLRLHISRARNLPPPPFAANKGEGKGNRLCRQRKTKRQCAGKPSRQPPMPVILCTRRCSETRNKVYVQVISNNRRVKCIKKNRTDSLSCKCRPTRNRGAESGGKRRRRNVPFPEAGCRGGGAALSAGRRMLKDRREAV